MRGRRSATMGFHQMIPFVIILTTFEGHKVSSLYGNDTEVKDTDLGCILQSCRPDHYCRGFCQDGCTTKMNTNFAHLMDVIQTANDGQGKILKRKNKCTPCDLGFDKYFRTEIAPKDPGSCYKILRDAGGWKSADRKCREFESHLAALETNEEINHILKIFRMAEGKGFNMHMRYWIGGRRVDGVWYWDMTGEKINTFNWLGDSKKPLLDLKLFKRDFLHVDPRDLRWFPVSEWTPSLGICEKKANCYV